MTIAKDRRSVYVVYTSNKKMKTVKEVLCAVPRGEELCFKDRRYRIPRHFIWEYSSAERLSRELQSKKWKLCRSTQLPCKKGKNNL